jgi:hypothetical protein
LLKLLFKNYKYFDPGEVLYLYESPFGYGLIALQLIGIKIKNSKIQLFLDENNCKVCLILNDFMLFKYCI